MRLPISAVLFDADGVVQRNESGWLESVKKLSGDPVRAEDFAAALFSAERPTMHGEGSFPEALDTVLKQWNSSTLLEDALSLWRRIEPNNDVLQRVRALRDKGITVAMATNQQAYRAEYMRNELKYMEQFDAFFCSCDLRCRKPSYTFFVKALEALRLEPQQVLLIDDDAENVLAARKAGLNAAQYHLNQECAALDKLLTKYITA